MNRAPFYTDVEVDSYASAFGLSWRGGRIWIAAGSPLNPWPRAPLPLAYAYHDSVPPPPTQEDIAMILCDIAPSVPSGDSLKFDVEAATLRAAANAHYGL